MGCAAGAGGSSGDLAIEGSAAVALALAAATAGRADSTLLEAMLVRCSTKELEVSPAALGDLRLASLLAGTEVVRQMDARATGFLRTVCQPAPIDDPRASLLPSESGGLSAFDEACTPFEAEVSEALTAAEILHSSAAVAGGLLVPLSAAVSGGAAALGGAAAGGRLAFFAEDLTSRAVYSNATSKRTAFQAWKYKVVSSAGWSVFPVQEAPWRSLVGVDEQTAHLRKLMQVGPIGLQA